MWKKLCTGYRMSRMPSMFRQLLSSCRLKPQGSRVRNGAYAFCSQIQRRHEGVRTKAPGIQL